MRLRPTASMGAVAGLMAGTIPVVALVADLVPGYPISWDLVLKALFAAFLSAGMVAAELAFAPRLAR